MGIAEVIPGVSGGTIAFITGIYEKLLQTINAFSVSLIQTLRKDGIKKAFEHINGAWLSVLLAGMVSGVLIGVFVITYLLEHYPVLLWSFFFGLILASCLYMIKKVDSWNLTLILSFLISTAATFFITSVSPVQGSNALPMVFISGVIAISALILPGISGSFMLLIMGMYTLIIPSIKLFFKTLALEHLVVLATFSLGCLVGLLTFSRLVAYAFSKYKNLTISVMTGFMLGSLPKIWPWRIPTLGLDEHGNYIDLTKNINVENFKIISESKVLPDVYAQIMGDSYLTFALLLGFLGFISIYLADSKAKG